MVTVHLRAGLGDVPFTKDAAVGLRDLVYLGASDTVFQATAAAPTPKAAIGFVVAIDGSIAKVRVDRLITGFSGLTPGLPVYLSTTAGQVTQTAPTASGQLLQEVGTAASPTDILISIDTDATLLT